MDLKGIGTIGADIAALHQQELGGLDVPNEHEAAGKKFEGLFATMLVNQMRKSLPEGFFGKGPGADSFGGWLDKSIGDALADSWDVGIAGMVKTSLDAKQARVDGEQQSEAASPEVGQ